MTSHSHATTLLLLSPLIAWRLYARIRRTIGRQRYSPLRLWFTLALMPVLLTTLCMAVRAQPASVGILLAAAAAGAALGCFGLRGTQFEATAAGYFYKPHTHLGLALTALFLARLLYRLLQLWLAADPAAYSAPDFTHSPLTLALVGLLAGYHTVYSAGILRWRHGLSAESKRQPPQ